MIGQTLKGGVVKDESSMEATDIHFITKSIRYPTQMIRIRLVGPVMVGGGLSEGVGGSTIGNGPRRFGV